MVLTDEERSYLFAELMIVYQDYNKRKLYGEEVLKSALDKCQSNDITFTTQENRLVQYHLTDRKEMLARLTDQRLQHVLMSQNNQGFAGRGEGGGTEHFFHSGKQYQLCLSIMEKLNG